MAFDLQVFNRQVYTVMTETADQDVQKFNEASGGAIVLMNKPFAGDFDIQSAFKHVSGLVRRRNAYGSGAVTAVRLQEMLDVAVKVAAGTAPLEFEPQQYRWTMREPELAAIRIDEMLAKERMADMLNAALTATAAAIGNNSAMVYDGSAAAPSFDALVQGAAKMGDRAGSLKGKVDSETGFFSIEASEPIAPDALRYNAVSQSTVPLDSSTIGINATRLPLDGKVPIFRAGGLVVIHNSISQDIGSAFTAGQTVQLERQNLDRLCVKDAAGVHIDAEKYDYDLTAGTLTWRTPLDLQGYTMPLTAVQFWEEDNRVVETSISGSLKLQNPLTRDFPLDGTYVSSAVVAGDLLVRATEPFSQKAWTGVWQNTRIGDALLAKTNVKDYPISISADGAINERWLLKFTSNTQFELSGESLGLIATGDILSDLAPTNPATNQPYFRLPAAAFGGGWAAQNCIRFNTTGTPIPLWIVRAIQPTGKRSTHKDGWTVCLRGDTIEV